MKKFLLNILPIAILFAAGLSIFCGFHFLSVGVRSLFTAGAILSGLMILFLAGLMVCFGMLYHWRRLERIPSRDLWSAILTAVLLGVLFAMVSPILRAKDPSNWQVIEIVPQPINAGDSHATVLLQEIKLDGQPVPLEEYQNVKGWRLTPDGLQSEPGMEAALFIQRKGALESGATILFGRESVNAPLHLRVGWNLVERIDFSITDRSQIEVFYPAPSQVNWAALSTLGLIFSIAALFLLIGLVVLPPERFNLLAASLDRLSRSPVFWIAGGLVVAFGLFFFQPAFLNSSNIMQVENNLPSIYPIGNDLHLILKAANSVAAGGSPYAGANKYPPLAAALFTTLVGLNFRDAFRVLSTANLFAFLFLSLGIPYFLSDKKRLENVAWIGFAAGLFSYGFFFEIERGQFNLIAMGLVFAAIILYHRAPKLTWLAFILFCLGVQLKIYPAIFVIFLTRDWRDWKANLLRWTALGLANLLLLLSLGRAVFNDFFTMITSFVAGLGIANWPLSHNINGLIGFMIPILGLTESTGRLIQAVLYILVISLSVLCFIFAVKRRSVLDPYLILACTLAALTIPSLSNDYTLAFLIGPAALFFSRLQTGFEEEGRYPRGIWPVMALGALAFTGTFFSYYHKPVILQNQFPALLILLVCAAVFSLTEKNFEPQNPQKDEKNQPQNTQKTLN
jgi:hypothetical protein